MRNPRWVLGVLIALSPVACDKVTEAEQTCFDTVDVIADAWEACGYNRELKRTETLARLRECDRVVSIRDETELRDECFPAIATLDCSDLEQDVYPPPCLDQILF